MRLYLLSTVGRVRHRYNYYDGYVIAAPDPLTARELANEEAAAEGRIWTNTGLATCRGIGVYTGPRKTPHIVLSSFNTG